MSLTTESDLINGLANFQQNQPWYKENVAATGGAFVSLWAANGQPGAGSLTVGQANGAVPVNTTAGAMGFTNASGGRALWMSKFDADYGATTASYILYDRLWHSGSHLVNATGTTTFSSPPAITRAPTDWSELSLWLEINVVIAAVNATVQVVYTNSAGTTSRNTVSVTLNAFTAARMVPLSLQAGDTSIQRPTGYIVGGSTGTGSFNIVVMRRLGTTRGIQISGVGSSLCPSSPLENMAPMFDSSCLALVASCASSTSGPCQGTFQAFQI